MAVIALVDDDDGIRSTIRKMIETDGHTVVEFNDGAPAIYCIDETNTDLVVTDLKMKTSGDVLVTTLREKGFQMPILIITGHLAGKDVNHLLEMGATFVLFKPFSLDQILDKINACLMG